MSLRERLVAYFSLLSTALSFHVPVPIRNLALVSLPESSRTEDWRDFRARLVGRSVQDEWAFSTGDLIEKGSIVLSEVESELGCHDLDQPYFHKAVVLLTHHNNDDDYTRGIILNRPTDLKLTDQDLILLGELDDVGNPVVSDEALFDRKKTWCMHFGGDLSGLYDETPNIVCLHSIASDLGRNVSDPVVKDLFVTSHEGACTLIRAGEAQASDFYTFYGHSEWEPKQLQRELIRGSWSMVAANSDTIMNAMKTQHSALDPREAGLSMWESLAAKIGKACTGVDSFSDLMLREWANEMLCVDCEGADYDTNYLAGTVQESVVEVGMLVRGSSQNPSPFLLHEQFLHKSTVLVFQETDEATVGLILDLPTTETYVLVTPNGKKADFTIRYGGSASGVETSEEPFVWLHCSKGLRKLGIGTPVSKERGGRIWTCTTEQVAEAIDLNVALPSEFFVVQGFTVWRWDGGISGQVLEEGFEYVPSTHTEDVWALLQSQKRLTKDAVDWNVKNSMNAWTVAGLGSQGAVDQSDRLVFGSTVAVSELADDALRNWVSIFLLSPFEA